MKCTNVSTVMGRWLQGFSACSFSLWNLFLIKDFHSRDLATCLRYGLMGWETLLDSLSKLSAERNSPHESDINIWYLSLMSIILSLSFAHSEEVKCTGKSYHTIFPFWHFLLAEMMCLYRHWIKCVITIVINIRIWIVHKLITISTGITYI